MRRADCSLYLAGTLCLFVKMLQIICSSGRNCKEIILSCNPLVHTRCSKHVAEVIHFEIINIPHSENAISASFPDDLLGGKITVWLLCSADQVYIILNFFLQQLIVCLVSSIDGRLHPFIEISVSKNGSVKISLCIAGTNFKILYYMADILAVEHVLQLGHGTVRAGVKTFLPKTAGPLYFHSIQGMNLRVRGSGCICQHDYSPSVISYSD